MTEISEALEAWRQAKRDLEATTPWTADWLRARMVEEERRIAYQALASDVVDEPPPEVDYETVTRPGESNWSDIRRAKGAPERRA